MARRSRPSRHRQQRQRRKPAAPAPAAAAPVPAAGLAMMHLPKDIGALPGPVAEKHFPGELDADFDAVLASVDASPVRKAPAPVQIAFRLAEPVLGAMPDRVKADLERAVGTTARIFASPLDRAQHDSESDSLSRAPDGLLGCSARRRAVFATYRRMDHARRIDCVGRGRVAPARGSDSRQARQRADVSRMLVRSRACAAGLDPRACGRSGPAHRAQGGLRRFRGHDARGQDRARSPLRDRLHCRRVCQRVPGAARDAAQAAAVFAQAACGICPTRCPTTITTSCSATTCWRSARACAARRFGDCRMSRRRSRPISRPESSSASRSARSNIGCATRCSRSSFSKRRRPQFQHAA